MRDFEMGRWSGRALNVVTSQGDGPWWPLKASKDQEMDSPWSFQGERSLEVYENNPELSQAA